jgi:ABC-type phosphonate transport system ATPase subunit
MEKRKEKSFLFDMPGIVLIDEVDNHLHLELQKRILQLLTTIFPNIQFIVSTHSPFILNSLDNIVIYDLEKALLINNGLTEIPYSGIVEGFFQADTLSDSLKQKYERYKQLVVKPDLSDGEIEEIAKLEMYLDEIPDYLALNITTEYQKFKLDFLNREDL